MDTTEREIAALIRDALADSGAAWSLGGFGALATFARGPDEPAARLEDDRLGVVTARGGIAFQAGGIVPVAYETAFGHAWSHAVALCLPKGAGQLAEHRVLIERGPDADAIRPRDRGAILFDAGLGLMQAALCLRSADPRTLARLRAACGKPADFAELRAPSMPLDRVMLAARGRIEVFDRRCDPGPDAPRLFVDAKSLRGRRTHAATAPISAGLVPFAHLHPAPSSTRDGTTTVFRPDRHAAFQAILRRWGDPRLVALKSALQGGAPLPEGAGRHERMVAKVVAAQSLAGASEST
ncbi:DUF6925 family protein [uncultured Methylobacterium sp.]|uniref:DUF6925 family protein n=1 Tax=uncultured Methylobacterium sp. TaxID=157278 RepID=UPI0035CB8E2D